MTFKDMLLMLGITEQFRIDVLQMVLVAWFFSVGYLLYKRANRVLNRQAYKGMPSLAEDLSCLTAGNYRATGV